MLHFKVVDEAYPNQSDLQAVIKYILKPNKTYCKRIGGFPMTSLKLNDIIDQFNLVKSIYHKESGKQVHHFIISFPDTKVVPFSSAYKIACQVACYIAEEFQIIFAIHHDTDSTHIHFVVNSVSYKTGLKNCFTLEKVNFLRREIEFIGLGTRFKDKYYSPLGFAVSK